MHGHRLEKFLRVSRAMLRERLVAAHPAGPAAASSRRTRSASRLTLRSVASLLLSGPRSRGLLLFFVRSFRAAFTAGKVRLILRLIRLPQSGQRSSWALNKMVLLCEFHSMVWSKQAR